MRLASLYEDDPLTLFGRDLIHARTDRASRGDPRVGLGGPMDGSASDPFNEPEPQHSQPYAPVSTRVKPHGAWESIANALGSSPFSANVDFSAPHAGIAALLSALALYGNYKAGGAAKEMGGRQATAEASQKMVDQLNKDQEAEYQKRLESYLRRREAASKALRAPPVPTISAGGYHAPIKSVGDLVSAKKAGLIPGVPGDLPRAPRARLKPAPKPIVIRADPMAIGADIDSIVAMIKAAPDSAKVEAIVRGANQNRSLMPDQRPDYIHAAEERLAELKARGLAR